MASRQTAGFDGRCLRRARLRSGLSQAELAARIGVKRNNITRWESEQEPVTPRLSTLALLADVLQVRPGELYRLQSERGLRRLRLRAGLTQRELGEAAGVPRSTISAIERGRMTPDLRVQTQLANALHVSAAELDDAPAARGE